MVPARLPYCVGYLNRSVFYPCCSLYREGGGGHPRGRKAVRGRGPGSAGCLINRKYQEGPRQVLTMWFLLSAHVKVKKCNVAQLSVFIACFICTSTMVFHGSFVIHLEKFHVKALNFSKFSMYVSTNFHLCNMCVAAVWYVLKQLCSYFNILVCRHNIVLQIIRAIYLNMSTKFNIKIC